MAAGLVEAELAGKAALEALGGEDEALFPLDLLVVPVGHLVLIQVEGKVQSAVGAGDRDDRGGLRVEVPDLALRRPAQQRVPTAAKVRIIAAVPDRRVLIEPLDLPATGLIVVHMRIPLLLFLSIIPKNRKIVNAKYERRKPQWTS